MFVPGLCHCNKIAQKKVEFQVLEWHRLRKKTVLWQEEKPMFSLLQS
jgi:hypothetical protein